MRFEINHLTRYAYTAPVVLERQVVRLKPVSNANQRLLSFDLDVQPAPAGQTTILDLDGNEAIAFWFVGPTDLLAITTTAVVETLRTNPFDYIWQGDDSLPVSYSPSVEAALEPYRARLFPEAIVDYGKAMAERAGGHAQTFLTALTADMHDRLPLITRDGGPAYPPEETLARGEGSCRDLSVLFMAVARSQGFATRFLSGYHAVHDGDEHDLHAWAEVYVPGGGWRGFDAGTGLAVSDRHIAVASGPHPEQASPVSGTYRGVALSTLSTYVEIREPAPLH